ncbi:MAG: hypothetical protein EA424_02990 [Planctomycetaceae bacterium]|nr:MAG: hypothetical protein EA424_02990 [Planctomycetaceae bacterium]
MPRLNIIQPDQTTGPLKQIYDDVTAKMGKVVNIFQGIANSPAALKACLSMSAALAEGELSPEDREVVYLAVSESNGGQIAESIGYIGLATFSNLFNHVHDTPLDFPAAQKLED